jgi:ArsR family transcriptional regulator, arsenate/arsenite/antimonite-responsive transcriptional repressor
MGVNATSTRGLPVVVDGCARVSVAAEPLDRPGAERLAKLLKAVADPARLQLLSIIHGAAEGEVCVCDLIEPLGLSQPTVSHHLKVLTDAGLLSRERRGTWAYFSVVPEGWQALRDLFA